MSSQQASYSPSQSTDYIDLHSIDPPLSFNSIRQPQQPHTTLTLIRIKKKGGNVEMIKDWFARIMHGSGGTQAKYKGA